MIFAFLIGAFAGIIIDAGTDHAPSNWVQKQTAVYEQNKDDYKHNTAKN